MANPRGPERKSTWRLSPTRKAGQRDRLRRVDNVIACVAESGVKFANLDRALELPKESEMKPRGECDFERIERSEKSESQGERGGAGGTAGGEGGGAGSD